MPEYPGTGQPGEPTPTQPSPPSSYGPPTQGSPPYPLTGPSVAPQWAPGHAPYAPVGYVPPHPAPAASGGRAFGFFVGLLCALAVTTVVAFITFGALAPAGAGLGLGSHVGLVRAEGLISGGTGGGLLATGGISPRRFLKELERALEAPACKAVVVRIDSPGGTASASEEIYRGMKRLKAEYPGKPIVVSMGDAAASGGYYMACAGDYVFANAATATGSIGVRSSFVSIEGLITEYGVEATDITSGEFKAMGSMYRDLTDEERAIFEHQVNVIYDEFVAAVVEGRGLPEATVRKVADGRVWMGKDAVDLGLVDELGGLHEAVAYAGAQAGLTDPEVFPYSTPALPFDSLMEASAQAALRGGERYLDERATGAVAPFRLQMGAGPTLAK